MRADGALLTPAAARGGVPASRSRCCGEALPELAEATLTRSDLARARELIAVNAVRGAKPIARLDGTALGTTPAPGPVCERLAAILRAAA